MSGGKAIITEATSVINEINISIRLSKPSASTERLPAIIPTTILDMAKTEFPIILIIDAVLMILFLSIFFLDRKY